LGGAGGVVATTARMIAPTIAASSPQYLFMHPLPLAAMLWEGVPVDKRGRVDRRVRTPVATPTLAAQGGA
jgi:hypothetical protein